MNHLSTADLVEHYYGEGRFGAGAHLSNCAGCARMYAALQSDLNAILNEIKATEPPERDHFYGERVWLSMAAALPRYELKKRSWLRGVTLGRGLSFAAACSLLLAGAFFAGRVWEQRKQPHTASTIAPARQSAPQPKQRVVVVVLGDHLDRSERLLVELKHADAQSTEMIAPLRDEARTLLAANRTFRAEAAQADNPELATALKHLDGLLAELANQPGGLDAEALGKLQREMKSDRLLFEVRVLRSRAPELRARVTQQMSGGSI
jgi:hypothetical protein